MVIQKAKIQILTILAIFCFGTVANFCNVGAISMSYACQQSQECREAKERQAAAEQNAANAESTANAFQNKVNELASEIAAKETEIAMSKASIEALNKEIEETEAKIEQEQDALADLLVETHFNSDSEPIRILAGSSSISDLAEKQAREEVIKEQISISATKIKEAKKALEDDKQEVENLLAEQESAKQDLSNKQAEQVALVEKYSNDAEAYEQVAIAEREAARKAEQAYQESHPEAYSGNTYAGAYNSYPWQGDCPGRQDDYTTYWNGAKIGGYVCECVSYAGWKAYEAFGVIAAWGNAYDWAWRARSAGYTVNNEPAAYTIGQSSGGTWGHVFWVEGVNSDGSINVTEYNNAYATRLYSGSYHYGDFGARTISASEARNYNYIHFE